MFGNTSNTFGSSNFGGFGQPTNNNQQQSGGLFGNKSAFGSTTTNNSFGTSSTFGNSAGGGGLFGAKPATSSTGGLFGSSNTTFGTTNTGFGNTASNTFGSTTNNALPFGSTGGGNSLFGGTSSAASTGGLFGSSNTSTFGKTNTFGTATNNAGTSLFGNSGAGGFNATQQNGTNIKYQPLISSDTQVIKGTSQTVQIKLHAISCMKEYENKCLDELRCEDYLAGRKGPQNGAAVGGSTGAGGLFGSTSAATTSTSLFGNTANKPNTGTSGLFGGSTATNTATSLFGNSAAKPTGGLFGSTNTSTGTTGGLFGSTSTNTFGNTTSFGNTTGTSLFGNTANNKPSTGLFGNTAANTGGGLFGNSAATGSTFGNTSNTNTGTNLFGNTSNTAATGGLFGNSATSGGLFGNSAANKPAFGNTAFGNTTSGTTSAFGNTAGTSLFGNTNTNKTGGLFGGTTGTTGGLFGNTNTGSTFGSTNTGGGLFGSTNTAQNKTGGLFGNTGTFGTANNTSSLFGNNSNTLLGNQANNQQPVLGASLDSSHIHQVVAALSATPFGDSPLFRTAIHEHKKTKSATPPSALVGNNKSRINSKLEKVRPRPIGCGYNQLFEGLEDDISPSPEAFLPRNSLKKLVLQSSRYQEQETSDVLDPVPAKFEECEETTTSGEILHNNNTDVMETTITPHRDAAHEIPQRLNTSPIKNISPIRKLPFNTVCDTNVSNNSTSTELHVHNPPLKTDANGVIVCKVEKPSTPEKNQEESEVAEEPTVGLDGKPLKAPPPQLPYTLQRPEYYTVPPAKDMLDLVLDQTLLVKDLVVGRTGYGEVKFLGLVDLWGLDLDSTVHFRRKEITVYPDDSVKPPNGEGLNRRSEVTLECVYPVDKGTRGNITDPKEIIKRGFPTKLEKMTAKMGAKFMEYKPESGQWIFMVKHFSQYGLLDESSEEDEHIETKKLKEEQLSEEDALSDLSDPVDLGCVSDEDNTQDRYDTDITFQPRPMPKEYEGYKAGLFGFNESDEEYMDDEEEGEMFVQANQFNFSSSISLSKKGILSKTALKMEKIELQDSLNSSPNTIKSALLADTPQQAEESTPNFGVSVVPSVLCLPPLSKSVASGRTDLKMDEGLARHFSYRVGWSGARDVIVKPTATSERKSNMKLFECSRGATPTGLEVHSVSCGTSPAYHTDLLEIQHEHTTLEEEEGSLLAVPTKGSQCLEALLTRLEETQDMSVLGSTLQLIKALWADEPDKAGDYAHEQFRRRRLGGWLGDQLKVIAQKHTIEYAKLGTCHLPAVIAWLCAGGVQEACQLLCKGGDFQLALLVSQSSTPIVRQLLLKQLHEWRDSGYDAMISTERLRLYVLLSGSQIWESSTRTINVSDGLDWLSSFSLLLRFLPPSAPLDQAVETFQQAFNSGELAAPVVDQDDNFSIFWQLLKLYCDPAHPLADVLNNQGITDNMLDERNVWFIYCTLRSLGLPPTSPQLTAKLITSYTAQLDRLGLWDWSVFVAQHHPCTYARLKTASDIINRNIPRNTTTVSNLDDREQTCLQHHKVEEGVFHCAHAQYSEYKRNWESVVTWRTAARDYSAAHRTFINKIGPYKILRREEEGLLGLLGPLHAHHNHIQNWAKEGGIYFSYLSLPDCLPQDKQECELLRNRISTLGHALNCLPYGTLSEQCAVNMMGLRTCTLLLAVWKQLFGGEENRELLLTMKTFPLPVDYELQDVITKISADIITEDNFDMVA